MLLTVCRVNGDQLILKVAQDTQWNSSKLAQEARESRRLIESTGVPAVPLNTSILDCILLT